jgi:uncharacterized protein
MQRFLITIFTIFSIIILLIFSLIYFNQEAMIFFPNKLSKNYSFKFEGEYNEINVKAKDGKLLNGLLFHADSTKGLIFYLHGNGGAIDSWGEIAATYTSRHYDVFFLDYRGYGKSEGEINSQKEVYDDAQSAYDVMKLKYSEDKIIVLGYSIGTGLAAYIASTNQPKQLILQAPYYSLVDMMQIKFPFLPTFLLKYQFETNQYLPNCKMPIIIFHGNKDEVIPYASTLKLKPLLKPSDMLITLDNRGHNNMSDNPEYLIQLESILEK